MDEDGPQWIDMENVGCHWIFFDFEGLQLTPMAHHGNSVLENDFLGLQLTQLASIFSHGLPCASVKLHLCPSSIK